MWEVHRLMHLNYMFNQRIIPSDWIMELGPQREYDVDGETVLQYSYSLVTDSRGLSLFVLARDVAEFEADFEDQVLATLHDIGFFTRLNSPEKGYHGDDCAYPSNWLE